MNNNIYLLLLAGSKSLLTKKEITFLKDNFSFLREDYEIIREVNLGKIAYRIPVLKLEQTKKELKVVAISQLFSLKEKKLSKYSLIKPAALEVIENQNLSSCYILAHEKRRIQNLNFSFKPNYKEISSELVLREETINLERQEVIIEINKGSYYKKESSRYVVSNNKDSVILSQLDRVLKSTHKFPYAYGSLIGVVSEDSDYADCFIVSKTNEIKEKQRFLLQRLWNKTLNSRRSFFTKNKKKWFLSAMLRTRDEKGEDPKFIYSDESEKIETVIKKINDFYTTTKGKKYNCYQIITDIDTCQKELKRLRKA